MVPESPERGTEGSRKYLEDSRLYFASMSRSALAGEERQRAMARSFELAVRHSERCLFNCCSRRISLQLWSLKDVLLQRKFRSSNTRKIVTKPTRCGQTLSGTALIRNRRRSEKRAKPIRSIILISHPRSCLSKIRFCLER